MPQVSWSLQQILVLTVHSILQVLDPQQLLFHPLLLALAVHLR